MLRRRVDRASRDGRAQPGHRRGRGAGHARVARAGGDQPLTCSTTSSRSSARPGTTRRSRWAPARAAGWRWSSWPAARRVLHQRDYVVPDDIKQVAVPALAHRVTLRPELWVRQVSADEVVARLLAAVPTPKTDPTARTDPSGPSRPSRLPLMSSSRHPEPAGVPRRRPAAVSTEIEPAVAVLPARPPPAHAGPGRRCSSRRGPAPGVRGPGRARAAAARPRAGVQRRPPRISVQVRPSYPAGFRGRAGRPSTSGRREARVRCSVTVGAAPGPGNAGSGAGQRDRRRRPAGPLHLSPRALGAAEARHRGRGPARPLAAGRRPGRACALPAIDCYPAPAEQRTEVVLSRLPNRLGEHRGPGAGRGHRVRRRARVRARATGSAAINWPASTRRGRLQVNTFAAERSQDVVLLVDAHLGRRRARALRARPGAARRGGARPAPTWRPGTGWA